MPISSAVADLTEVVAQQCAPLTPWEVNLRANLALMPERVAEHDLGWWESHFRHVWAHGPEDEVSSPSQAACLFGQIFEFGSYNLFGAFDSDGTRAQYEALVANLNHALAGAAKPEHDVTCW